LAKQTPGNLRKLPDAKNSVRLYGEFLMPTAPPIQMARSTEERINELAAHLTRAHAIDPAAIQVVKAPLRLCPLGAHIDHQLGPVTGMTIDQSILLAFAPTDDGLVHVNSVNFNNPRQFYLENVPPYQPRDWGNYTRGAVEALKKRYRLQQGLVGVIGGDMPVGGLSSSAAVTIAYLLALETVNGLTVSPRENIELVRYTENEYIGLNNGILDQSVILFSDARHLTLIDPQSMIIDQIASPRPDAFEILVVYSGLTRALVGTNYNNRVAECQQAAGLLLNYQPHNGQQPPPPRLRYIEPETFLTAGHHLPAPLKRRATHYFGEMQRVDDGVQAWRNGNLEQFGALMNESGASSIHQYECGSPHLITLYEILRATPGVYGARFSGAGFRGNCIALIDPHARDAIAAAVHHRYPVTHPAEAEAYSIHFCRPDGNAQLIPWSK
jgi:galactokinase